MINLCDGCEWFRLPLITENSLRNKQIPSVISEQRRCERGWCNKQTGTKENRNVSGKGTGMKAILTKKQVEMLLEGKKLTYGRRSVMVPKEGEIPDQLKGWLSDDRYQKRYNVVVDTNELSIDFVLREGAEQNDET